MESSPRLKARIAGLLYLIVIVAGGFAELFFRARLIVRDDAAATAANILASEPLFRLGAAADLICAAAYVAVTLLLYDLFRPVSRSVSLLAAFFSLIGIAVMAANLGNHVAPLLLLGGAHSASAFSAAQSQALAYAALRLHGLGYTIAVVFFGFYCILIGWLVIRSTFMPRILGVLMAIGGASYLVNSFAVILSPALAAQLLPILLAALIGEGSLCLWLIFVGVNSEKWEVLAKGARAPDKMV